MIELQGNWKGYYTFGEEYEEWGEGRQVLFHLTVESVNNKFVGKVEEDAASGGLDDDFIMVRGHRSEDEIYFTKFYSKEHITLNNFEILSIESDNPHVVNYEGRYDYEARKYKGTWMIPVLEMDDHGVLQDSEGGTGGWEMWKDD